MNYSEIPALSWNHDLPNWTATIYLNCSVNVFKLSHVEIKWLTKLAYYDWLYPMQESCQSLQLTKIIVNQVTRQ